MPSAVRAAGFSTAAGASACWATRAVSGAASSSAAQRVRRISWSSRAGTILVGRDLTFTRCLGQHGSANGGSGGVISQYGVLPYRVDREGRVEILLITSRERRRWVGSKGNTIPFFLNHESAAREAFEEAGVEGKIATVPIGSFRYEKRRSSGRTAAAAVTLYPLLVTRQAKDWPERRQRETRWFSGAQAAAAVEEPELAVIILSFCAGKDVTAPRTPLAIIGVNRFSWGYRMLKVFRSIMPKEDRFFDMFERHAQILVAGADALGTLFEGGERIADSCRRIHEHEKAADDVTRDVLVGVRRSFITPFDRSAITALTSAMDDAIDEMWQTAKAVTLYEVASFAPQMKEMAGLAGEAARLVAEAVPLMRKIGRHPAA